MIKRKSNNNQFCLVAASGKSKNAITCKNAVFEAAKKSDITAKFTLLNQATKVFDTLYSQGKQPIAIFLVIQKHHSNTMFTFLHSCVGKAPFLKVVFLVEPGKEESVSKIFPPYTLMGIDHTVMEYAHKSMANMLKNTARTAALRKRQQTALAGKPVDTSTYTLGQDVSAYRKYETQEQYLGALLPAMNMAVIVVNPKGKVEIWNTKAEEYFGVMANKAVGSVFSTLGGESWVQVLKRISTEMKGEEVATLRLKDHKLHLDKGKEFYADIHYSVLKGSDGQVIGTLYLLQDVTLIREVDKAKTEFVSLASHQLRMPISTINWYSQTLLKENVTGTLEPKQKEYVVQIEESSKQMTNLVDTLLNVSRIELGTFVVNAKQTLFKKMLQKVTQPFEDFAKEKEITLTIGNTTPVPHYVVWDENIVDIMLGNLISNAIKYTPAKGRVDVTVGTHTNAQREKALLFSVYDTGYGIPKKEQEKIFSKLFRAENITSKDTDGTGLGLYLVRLVATHIGAEVWFDSPAKSLPSGAIATIHKRILKTHKCSGTAFHLSLPLDVMETTKKTDRIGN
jgi:two-component system, OmpR family, phosphate regulon sensor histidine kinase PhoR